MRRVVVTGLGLVCPVGLDVESSWKALLAGTSGIGRITLFDASDFFIQIAGEVKDFDPAPYMDFKMARRSGRFAQIGTAAAKQALCSGGMEVNAKTRDEIGIVCASSGGVFQMGKQEQVIEDRGPTRVDPLLIPKLAPHMAAARIGRVLGVRGPNTTINSACASGTDALGHAFNMIRTGDAEVLLAGAAEAIIAPLAVAAMGVLGALTKDWNDRPQQASRPFDARRSGFVLGEGAGMFLMETEEHAKARGAKIICEFAGAGWSFDATDDAAPDAEGQALAMTRALRSAGVTPDQVDYINAHGTSTELNDRAETAAIKLALGENDARRVAISSTKSMTGHAAAGAGGLEAVITALCIRDNVIPPTINYEEPDPDCDLDYTPNKRRELKVNVALSNSFGLGGQNATIVLKRYQP